MFLVKSDPNLEIHHNYKKDTKNLGQPKKMTSYINKNLKIKHPRIGSKKVRMEKGQKDERRAAKKALAV